MAEQSTTIHTQLWRLVGLLVGGVLLALIAGNLLGTPVVLSFVETGSMEPTIQTGDGFVVLPPAVTGDVSAGDVVVFDARELEGGGLTTHRIVNETDDGYITQGDANPFTDQDDSEPPVSDDQIVAVAWQPNGQVLTVPYLGTASMELQATMESAATSVPGGGTTLSTDGSSLLLVVGIGFIVLSFLFEQQSTRRPSSSRSRSRSLPVDPRKVVLAVGVLVCAITGGTMIVMADSSELTVISAEFDSDRPDVILQDTTERQSVPVDNGGLLPVVSVLESGSERLVVEDTTTSLAPGASAEPEVSITAPAETGRYSHLLTEYRYFGVLPPTMIVVLHSIHPLVAIVAVAVTIGGIVSAPLAMVVTMRTVRTRTRSRSRTRQDNDGFW